MFETTQGFELICDWIRSDACHIGTKMVLDRVTINPLVKSIDAALAAAYARGQRDMRERAAKEAMRLDVRDEGGVSANTTAYVAEVIRALPIKEGDNGN